MAIQDSIEAARKYGKIRDPKDPKITFLERLLGKEKKKNK